MAILFANNATTTLAAPVELSDTTLFVAGGAGQKFPATPAPSDYFMCTLVNASNQIEIVRVTARSGDALTVLRAQEGTTTRPWFAGDRVELRLTRGSMEAAQRLRLSARAIFGDTPVTADDGGKAFLCQAESGPMNVTLPTCVVAGNGFTVTVKKISGSHAVTIRASGLETIEGASTRVFTAPGDGATFLCDGGSTWQVCATSPVPATEAAAGVIELASAAEVQAGTDAARAVTPAGLASFPRSLGTDGYARLPGGLIVQWGHVGNTGDGSAGSSGTVTFPLAFPTTVFTLQLTVSEETATPNGPVGARTTAVSLTEFTWESLYGTTFFPADGIRWLALGN